MDTANPSPATGFELLFVSLFDDGRGFSFPCDAAGRIDLDRLGDRARDSYDRACSAVGRDVAWPRVHASSRH